MRTKVRYSAEIELLSITLSVAQGAPLGDFMLAHVCAIAKVTLTGALASWQGDYLRVFCRICSVWEFTKETG